MRDEKRKEIVELYKKRKMERRKTKLTCSNCGSLVKEEEITVIGVEYYCKECLNEIQEKCEHDFEYEQNWKENIEIDTCFRLPVICSRCGLKADETWTETIYTNKTTGEVLE